MKTPGESVQGVRCMSPKIDLWCPFFYLFMMIPQFRWMCLTSLTLFLSLIRLSAQEKPLNVLFIAIDDMRPEMGFYGGKAITPNMDRLAATGVVFDRAYCNQAVCGASRVSLMTGLYPEYLGERTYHVTGWRKRWSHIVTMNQHFKSNGYTTIGLGKIYHGSRGPGVDPDHWTRWIIPEGGTEYANPANTALRQKNQRDTDSKRRGPSTESFETGDETHFDGVRALTGARQIAELSKEGKPFFLAVGFTKPHLPFIAPKKYWDLYERDSFHLPGNLSIPPGYPDYARNKNAGELRAYSDIPQGDSPEQFSDELNKTLLHGYHASISYTDRNIGVLLDALDDHGVADNTIVVLWADHGWKLGDHSSWCKHTNFECDTRVPLMIRHPGMPNAKGRSQSLVELLDLYPTLCDLCGLERPEHLQGKSLVDVLENPGARHLEIAYSSYPHGRGQGQKGVVGHSIRTTEYRYTEWWEKGSDKVVDSVLSHVEKDPGEATSITGAPEIAQALSDRLRIKVMRARKD